MPPTDLFLLFTGPLEAVGLDYMVSDSVAAIVYGEPRLTNDVDIILHLRGADVYIEVAKDVPGADMATISGSFLCKVFEGPYRNMRKWIAEMKGFVRSKGTDVRKMYFFYTTCPKCAKKYGKNYVAILAQT
jgi:hypothetical protein